MLNLMFIFGMTVLLSAWLFLMYLNGSPVYASDATGSVLVGTIYGDHDLDDFNTFAKATLRRQTKGSETQGKIGIKVACLGGINLNLVVEKYACAKAGRGLSFVLADLTRFSRAV